MIKLLINISFLIILISCQLQGINQMTDIIDDKRDKVNNIIKNKKIIKKNKKPVIKNNNILKYVLGDSYFINGVEYIPEENYKYDQIGLATFYNKELHNKKTINNDYNKVTELLGRHKTLPIPSIVKITNLENGLSLNIKINDRHSDNSAEIQVSRKVAQLLKFYKDKITKVRIQILADPSKQMKIVTLSMNESTFNETIISAPTEKVSIIDIDNEPFDNKNLKHEIPIELEFTEISNNNIFLKVYGFTSYKEAKNLFINLKLKHKFIIQNDKNDYSMIIGPLENIEANNLVLSFIAKGYKKTEFIMK